MSQYFLSDLDGTLIKGDTCNGGKEFPGIIQALYENGLVPYAYYIPNSYREWKRTYDEKLSKFDTTVSRYPWIVYTGTPEQDAFINKYWENVLSRHFVEFTRQYLENRSGTNKIIVVSGTPTCYTSPIKNHLPFVEEIIGTEKDDHINFSFGKLWNIQSRMDLDRVSGYIGDVWVNDGPIMSHLRMLDQGKDLIFIEHGQITPIDRMHLDLYNIRIVHGF